MIENLLGKISYNKLKIIIWILGISLMIAWNLYPSNKYLMYSASTMIVVQFLVIEYLANKLTKTIKEKNKE